MITIKKNGNGFLVSDKKINWGIESANHSMDFGTYSKEGGCDTKTEKTIFDWPGEYEKNGVEIKGIEICNEGGIISFNFRLGKISITHIPESIEFTSEEFNNELEGIDILLVSMGKNSNLKTIKGIINKIEARITVFGGENREAAKELIQNCEQVEDVKINNLPIDKSEYYILI